MIKILFLCVLGLKILLIQHEDSLYNFFPSLIKHVIKLFVSLFNPQVYIISIKCSILDIGILTKFCFELVSSSC